jgi:DNA repair protein RadA/Sms
VDDPALDLAVVAAILSSDTDQALPKGVCFAGEVGLSGEIRPVARIEQRIGEAERMGFAKIFVSEYNLKGIQRDKYGIKVIGVKKIEEAFRELYG